MLKAFADFVSAAPPAATRRPHRTSALKAA